MREIPYESKMEALDLYLQGLTADQVVERTGLSKGTVVSVIGEARQGKYPQADLKGKVDELHRLAAKLRKQGLNVTQARLGFTFLERLLATGVSTDKVEEWLDFCSQISPEPPNGFIPAAMELLRVGKETGLSYDDLSSKVADLYNEQQRLLQSTKDLQAKEKRGTELNKKIGQGEKQLAELTSQKTSLEGEVNSLRSVIEERARALGIPVSELEEKLGQLLDLDAEIASRQSERDRLQGEVEALTQRRDKLSRRMEKASSDFQRDISLVKEMHDRLAEVAEMKGKYEGEVKDMQWASQILPFLRYHDKIDDPEYKLAAAVVACIDKWLPTQNLGFPWQVKWSDIVSHVQSRSR
ncbi:MAG: hypothetical protein ACOC6S_03280 [Chloroflexota bacterium]